MLTNRQQNMSSLCVGKCSKVYVSSLKFELIAEKRSQNLPSSIDRELGLIDRESQKSDYAEFLNQAQAHENI